MEQEELLELLRGLNGRIITLEKEVAELKKAVQPEEISKMLAKKLNFCSQAF